MADFSLPNNNTIAELVIDYLKAQITSVSKLFIGTSDTNVPDGAVRYNETVNKFQKKAGSSWANLGVHTAIDGHIADTTIHTPFPTGAVIPFAGTVLPSGWDWADGGALNRTTQVALFTVIGTNFGSGDGSTTFNKPNLQTRFLLGRASSGSYQTLGATGGQMDHVHAQTPHTHTIAGHTHLFAHTHGTPAHQHTSPSHAHTVAGHFHYAVANGGDIQIAASGSHQHHIRKSGGSLGSVWAFDTQPATTDPTALTYNDTQSNHPHPSSVFSGRVGNVPGSDGDAGFSTGYTTVTTTAGEGGGTTTSQSTTTTGSSGTQTTDTSAAVNTGIANPPYIVLNYIIKL